MMPTGEEIYKAIKESITRVVDMRLVQNSPAALYPREILVLLDEMARNASQAVVGLLPREDGEPYEPNDVRIGGHPSMRIGVLRKSNGAELDLSLQDMLVVMASLEGRDYNTTEASRLYRKLETFYAG